MSRLRGAPATPVLAWSGLLAALTALAIAAFDVEVASPALLGGAALAALLLGLALALARPGPAPALLAEPETSAATVWLAAALALLAVSAVAGPWLTLIAAGMTGVGVGGVLRELRAQRRALKRGGGDGGD